MDLKISTEVNHVKTITQYTTLAASHFNGKTIHCYCGLNGSATADTSSAAHSKPLSLQCVQLSTNKHEILVFMFVWITSEFLAQIRQDD
jgi:hypothetical protein